MQSHGVKYVLNAGASPDYNPIEGAFSVVKNAYKKMKIQKMIDGKDLEELKMAKKAFRSLSLE